MTSGDELALSLDELGPTAKRLEAEYRAGDKLAPFECCWEWRRNGLPWTTLPAWVVESLADLAARYFAEAPYKISEDHLKMDGSTKGGKLSPRKFLEVTPSQRRKVLPFLDDLAGMRAEWARRIRTAPDLYADAYLAEAKRRARLPDSDPKRLIGIPDGHGGMVPVLDTQGRLSEAAQQAVGKRLRLGRRGNDDDAPNKSRTVRRRLRNLRTDK